MRNLHEYKGTLQIPHEISISAEGTVEVTGATGPNQAHGLWSPIV
jgi:hypothetical protein